MKILPFRTFVGADLLTEIVIGADEPLAIPTVLMDGLVHLLRFRAIAFRFVLMTAMLGNRRQFFSCEHEQARDKDRLGGLTFFVRSGLERLAGCIGEAVQVEAVVPVGATDERQSMRPQAVYRVLEAALQVLVERLLGAWFIVVGNRFVEDAPIARFLDIGGHADDQPVRIVVEVAANVIVPALGERLILMIGAAGWQLRRGEVEDTFPRARWHHVHEAQQVLVGIAEAQSAADS